MLKLSELINSSARYQYPRDMRFLRVGRLYFNSDVSSCAILIRKKNKFYLLNITYVYVTGFTLAEPT